MGVCETKAKLVIKQNNAPPDSFSRIYLCPFKQNKEKPFWTRLLPGYEVENDGSWNWKEGKNANVCCSRLLCWGKYIVVCSNIRCQIYFGKKLFICSFNRIYSRSKTLFRQNQLTLEQKKIKSSKNNFRKRLVITNYGLWTCVDRAELGKTDWREEKQENVVANTEIRIQFEKGGHNPQNKIENLVKIDLCFRFHVYFQGGRV